MTTLPSARYWQPKLGELGATVSDADDINQAMAIILITRWGECPHRPEFGSEVWKYLDRPWSMALPLITQAALAALARWELRATVTRLKATLQDEPGHVKFSITWQWAGQATGSTTEVSV